MSWYTGRFCADVSCGGIMELAVNTCIFNFSFNTQDDTVRRHTRAESVANRGSLDKTKLPILLGA